jgi:hypothetical protein
VAAVEAAVWAPVEESETVPVTVVEPEPWSGARRHGAGEAHSLQALLVEEPEKVAAVEAPDDAGTPARARRGEVVSGPRVARVEALGPRVARRGAPWTPGPRVAWRGAPMTLGPRVARPKAPSPRQVRRMAPEPRVVQEEAPAPPEEPQPVVYQKNLLEKEKQKQATVPPGQKTWTQCQDPEWVWRRRKRGSPTRQTQHVEI